MGILLLRAKVDLIAVSVVTFEKHVSKRGRESFHALGHFEDRTCRVNICQLRELMDQEFWTAVDLPDNLSDSPLYSFVAGQHLDGFSSHLSVYLSWDCEIFVLQCEKMTEEAATQEMARILHWLYGSLMAVKRTLELRRKREG